jgi:type 1 glutamine amidotransferase
MSRKALIVQGGWPGHEPEAVANLFADILREEAFEVEISDTLDAFCDEARLRSLELLIPVWTMGEITEAQLKPVLSAVSSGVGLAGCHGGMCDAFRSCTEWQFMTGGQFVAHPGDGGVRYAINITDPKHPITSGIADFEVTSEQYYMHVDPAIHVLATTTFPGPPPVRMPAVWTKNWGDGRVFYTTLGHSRDVLEPPHVRQLLKQGFLWAAK